MRMPAEIHGNTAISRGSAPVPITKTSAKLQNRHRLREQHSPGDGQTDVNRRGKSTRTEPAAELMTDEDRDDNGGQRPQVKRRDRRRPEGACPTPTHTHTPRTQRK